jgi:Dynamin family
MPASPGREPMRVGRRAGGVREADGQGMNAFADNPLARELERFQAWRHELTRAVDDYSEWLDKTGQLDTTYSLRFYELLDNIRQGRLLLAFVAEFSRGKTELINALFFSQYKQRLLPSNVGRTTMCPTEIFHDPAEEPYLRLLPIESRYREESIAHLKKMPVEWIKIRLNLDSFAEMKQALDKLAEVKKIFTVEARMMGLLGDNETASNGTELDTVDAPVWRYAMINFPHPLLTNGISILDTPGLNALGLEPELTLSALPNAHAVLFLVGIDTGVTRSDLDVYHKYVQKSVTRRVAVLNKIDLLWDDIKSEEEIDEALRRQITHTARELNLSVDDVLALSAQKALVGKIRQDDGLVRRSGILKLEQLLADDIIPSRRRILSRAVVDEMGAMMASSRQTIVTRVKANEEELEELSGLGGKSREVVAKMWEKITASTAEYMNSVKEYKAAKAEFRAQRDALIETLNPAKLELLLSKSLEAINGTWTTSGLMRGMGALFDQMEGEFNRISARCEEIKALIQRAYDYFHERYQFERMRLPPFELETLRLRLKVLAHETDDFCHDPVNIMTEKHFLVKKFYASLVLQARQLFSEARSLCEDWLKRLPVPLEMQIREHKTHLDQRLGNLAKINESNTSLQERMLKLKLTQTELKLQLSTLDELIVRLYDTLPDDLRGATPIDEDLPQLPVT